MWGLVWEESGLCLVPPAPLVRLEALAVLGAARLHSLPQSPMEISLSRRVRHLGTHSSRKHPPLTLLRSEG